MKKEEFIKKAEEVAAQVGFTAHDWYMPDNTMCFDFNIETTRGQDFYVSVTDIEDEDGEYKWKEVVKQLEEYFNGYDVSSEAYLWLDNFGHGKNGAPYEMIDVYKDCLECKRLLKKLIKAARA